MQHEAAKETTIQGADEECRASEMYGYVSACTSQKNLQLINAAGSPMRLRSQKKLHKVVQDAVKKMPEVRDKQKEGFKAV